MILQIDPTDITLAEVCARCGLAEEEKEALHAQVTIIVINGPQRSSTALDGHLRSLTVLDGPPSTVLPRRSSLDGPPSTVLPRRSSPDGPRRSSTVLDCLRRSSAVFDSPLQFSMVRNGPQPGSDYMVLR